MFVSVKKFEAGGLGADMVARVDDAHNEEESTYTSSICILGQDTEKAKNNG